MEHIIYTDGGCHNTNDGHEAKGVGAWAYAIVDNVNESIDVYTGYEEDTTNNRTEMLAVINGIKSFPEHSVITIVTDSGYVATGFTHPSYLERWIKSGWLTSTGNPVLNQDLWRELHMLSFHYGLKFIHIRGHNKDSNKLHAHFNGMVDDACTKTMKEKHDMHLVYDVLWRAGK